MDLDPSVVAALLAVVGTLLGAIVVGLLQGWQARRQRQSQEREGAAQRETTRQALDRQLKEERFLRLRSERRELYCRVLDVTDEWFAALQELRDSDKEKMKQKHEVRTLADARELMPIAATNVELMQRMMRLSAEVQLLADTEVRIAVDGLDSALRQAFRAVVEVEKEVLGVAEAFASINRQRAQVVAVMRRELVYG